MSNIDTQIPSEAEIVARAEAMIPWLREKAESCEKARMVSRETIQAFQEAGFFKILQPKRWGGYEMDPRVFYTVQMALAEGCMATAWIYGVSGVQNWGWRSNGTVRSARRSSRSVPPAIRITCALGTSCCRA